MVKDRFLSGRRRDRRMKSIKLRSRFPKRGERRIMKRIERKLR